MKLAPAVLLSLALASTSALAKGGEEEHHNHFFIGANSQLLGLFGTTTEVGYGGGAFFEFTVIENWLEVEVAFHAVATSAGKLELPIEVLAKKPWHPAHWVTPYVGLGPIVTPVIGSYLYAGVAVAGGAYFWVTDWLAVQVEANNNLVFGTGDGAGKIVNEFGGTVGLVVGF
jgi:hypothetical protein